VRDNLQNNADTVDFNDIDNFFLNSNPVNDDDFANILSDISNISEQRRTVVEEPFSDVDEIAVEAQPERRRNPTRKKSEGIKKRSGSVGRKKKPKNQ
jgi:hypothetical protein